MQSQLSEKNQLTGIFRGQITVIGDCPNHRSQLITSPNNESQFKKGPNNG